MIEELEFECPPAPRLTLAEVGDIVASWVVVGSVFALLGICALAESLSRRDRR